MNPPDDPSAVATATPQANPALLGQPPAEGDMGASLASFINSAQHSNQFSNFYYNPETAGSLPNTPPANPQEPSKGGGKGGILGFLERNAQNIGGIGGGILGGLGAGALDVATLGAAAPFVNPFTGAVAGAALGGGIGQEVKNVTDPKEASNPFKEGAIQGIGEAAGQGIGKGVGIIGEHTGDMFKNAATSLFKNAFKATGKAVSDINIDDTVGKALNYGWGGTLRNMISKSEAALDPLESLYRQSIAPISGTIDTTVTSKAVTDSLNGMGSSELSDTDKKYIQQRLQRTLFDSNSHMKLDPQSAVDAMRQLQREGQSFLEEAGQKGTQNHLRFTTMGNALKSAGDSLQNALDDASSTADISALKTPENQKLLSDISPNLAKDFMATKTPQEIRHLMQVPLNLRRLSYHTLNNPTTGRLLATLLGGGVGSMAGGPIGGMVGGMIGSPILEGFERELRAPLSTRVAEGISGLGGMLGRGAKALTSKEILPGVGLTAPDLAHFIGGGMVGGGLDTATANAQGNPGTPTSLGIAPSVNSAVQAATPQQQSQGGLPGIDSVQEYQNILNAVGYNGIDNYLNLQKQESPQLTQEQQSQWESNQNALNAIQDFAKTFDSIKAKGAGAGALEELGTHIPGIQNLPSEVSLKTYNDSKSELAKQIAQVLGGAANSDAGMAALERELPDVSDSPAAAMQKLQTIIQRLGQNLQTIMAAPATNTPGQLSNFNGMSVPGTIPPYSTGM